MENCEDLTHYDIAHGKIKELVDSLPLPAPRTAEEEQAYWLTWVMNFIRRVFLVNKIKEPESEATIEEDISTRRHHRRSQRNPR
jgi:hypothetical protein